MERILKVKVIEPLWLAWWSSRSAWRIFDKIIVEGKKERKKKGKGVEVSPSILLLSSRHLTWINNRIH